MIRKFWRAFWNLLFPNFCGFCQVPLRADLLLCEKCVLEQERIKYPPQNYPLLAHLICSPNSGANLVQTVALYYFVKNSPVQVLVHQLKYAGNLWLAREFGREIAELFSEIQTEIQIDGIIPVPLHLKKYKQRGYNQSEELAKAISKITKIPVLNKIVKRVKNTASLAIDNKNMQQRSENIAGAFQLCTENSQLNKLENGHILLVDDVLTTGSTMRELISVLLKSYPKLKLSIAVIATTEGILTDKQIMERLVPANKI